MAFYVGVIAQAVAITYACVTGGVERADSHVALQEVQQSQRDLR